MSQQQERVELSEPLFTDEELEEAMELDSSIEESYAEIYRFGIVAQARDWQVTPGQAKAIGITHKKIAKALSAALAAKPLRPTHRPVFNDNGLANEGVEITHAERIDSHLGNLIGELEALRRLFKEMQ